VAAAHHDDARAVGQSPGALRIPADAFTGQRSSAQRLIQQPFVPVENGSVRRLHLEVVFQNLFRFRVVVVIVANLQLAIGRKRQQTFDSLDIFNGKMRQLRPHLQE
jgi:hypothetical protein